MQRPTTVLDAVLACTISRSDGAAPTSDAAMVRARGRRGELVQIVPGAWVPRDVWRSLWPEHKHAVRVMAAAPRRPESAIISHLSAAAVRGWSLDAAFPTRVHLTVPQSDARRANRTFVVHAEPGDLDVDPTGLDRFGIPLTTGARTAADLALALPFRDGVTILDQAIRVGTDRATIRSELESRHRRGMVKATEALDFADAGAANVGESVMRVLFRSLGFPTPVTQHAFREGSRIAFVDFWFPDEGVIVEFDGLGKYTDPALLSGRSTREALIAEKEREDWLRSFDETRGFVRFGWRDRQRADFVRGRCERAGLRAAHRRRS